MLLVDAATSILADGLADLGARVQHEELTAPFRPSAPAGSVDVVIGLWSLFRGVTAADLTAADRILRPGGRLLVVHDYGRDDVSRLGEATKSLMYSCTTSAPETVLLLVIFAETTMESFTPISFFESDKSEYSKLE